MNRRRGARSLPQGLLALISFPQGDIEEQVRSKWSLSGCYRSLVTLSFCLLFSTAIRAQGPVTRTGQTAIMQVEDALRDHQYSRAIELTSAALRRDPRDVRIWTLQGMAYSGAGRPPLAFSAYRQALKLHADYLPALEGAAQVGYQQGDQSAKPFLDRLIRLRPDDPTTNAMEGTLAYRRGDCDSAVPYFAKSQSPVASQPSALTQFGICLSMLNRTDEAITMFQQADALEPGSDVGHYNLALALWKAKRYDEAFSALQPTIDAGTRNEDVLTLAADIDESRNDTPRAVEILRRGIQENPRDVKAYIWFATLASNHSSFQTGIDMLDAGLRVLPKEGQLYLARGVLYAQLGDFDKAAEDFEAAHKFDPQLSFAGTAEGIIATQKHDLNASIDRFRQQVRNHPNSAFDHYLLAESLRQRGAEAGSADYVEGLHAASKAVDLDPNLTLAHEILADFYLSAGNTALAAEHCQAVLRQDPNNQEALYRLILTLRKSGRKDEIPELTKRLVALRNSQNTRDAQMMRYQLVDNVVHTPGQPDPEGSHASKQDH
jgi:tetratricopeptide (TPR) repeat protein